jgi:hypothetical protein
MSQQRRPDIDEEDDEEDEMQRDVPDEDEMGGDEEDADFEGVLRIRPIQQQHVHMSSHDHA